LQKVDDAVKVPQHISNIGGGCPSCSCKLEYHKKKKKGENKAPQEGFEYVIHEGLECGGGVGQAERHDKEFIVALVHAECYFRDVLRAHLYLVISRTKVELRENDCTMELVQ